MSKPLSQNQKTFNKVARHLLKQNAKALDSFGHCQYRAPNGLRCGIGALIPNRLYNPEMEDKTPECEVVAPTLESLGHDPQFCRNLQSIHDAHSPTKWRYQLEKFAAEKNLKMVV